jgi:DNA-binding IclR family transcriptional regulator
VTDCKLFTSHALALVCIARDNNTRLRDIADCLRITERATQRIVSELCAAGYLTKHQLGSRNFYEIHPDAELRQPLVEGHDVGQALAPLLKPAA